MINFDDYFDRIFVINLDFRKDKWEIVTKNLSKMNIKNYERFSAIRPLYDEIDPRYKQWFHEKNHSDGTDETYSIGALGCKLSHLNIIKLARERNYKKILVLEDDVEFRDDALFVFNKALTQLFKLSNPSWDMLYFTGNHGNRYVKVDDNLIRIYGSYSTVGYAVSNNLFNFILNNAYNYFKHIDIFYKEKVHPVFNCYCIQPHLVWNIEGFSDIEQGYRDYKVLKRKYI